MSDKLRVEKIGDRPLELNKGNKYYKINNNDAKTKKSNDDEIYFYQVLKKQMEFDQKLQEERQKRR